MSELVKDLLNILTKEVIRCGDSVETRKTEAYFLADRLSDLGYVKVVRCGQCKAWCLDEDQSNMVDDDGKDRRYCLISNRYMRVDDYCSEGEAKEGTNA